MRYEKKYRIEGLPLAWVENAVKNHPANFQTIYPDRQINNIYFDTVHLNCFYDNIDGVPDRDKYRLRWYGPVLEELKNPVFETKIKRRELGEKQQQALQNSSWNSLDNLFAEVPVLAQNSLIPVLVNSYQRAYYLSADQKFRLTIDRALFFGPYSPITVPIFHEAMRDEAIVVEIKYEADDDKNAADIFKYLPFRQTKNSKYATGINLVLG